MRTSEQLSNGRTENDRFWYICKETSAGHLVAGTRKV